MPRSERMNELIEQERERALELMLEENPSIRAMMEQLERQVARRIEAARAERKAFEEVAHLASDLRRHGVEVPMIMQKIKRFDRSDGKVKSITRQAFDGMIATYEGRRATTRAGRRRRGGEPGGGVNLEALR